VSDKEFEMTVFDAMHSKAIVAHIPKRCLTALQLADYVPGRDESLRIDWRHEKRVLNALESMWVKGEIDAFPAPLNPTIRVYGLRVR